MMIRTRTERMGAGVVTPDSPLSFHSCLFSFFLHSPLDDLSFTCDSHSSVNPYPHTKFTCLSLSFDTPIVTMTAIPQPAAPPTPTTTLGIPPATTHELAQPLNDMTNTSDMLQFDSDKGMIDDDNSRILDQSSSTVKGSDTTIKDTLTAKDTATLDASVMAVVNAFKESSDVALSLDTTNGDETPIPTSQDSSVTTPVDTPNDTTTLKSHIESSSATDTSSKAIPNRWCRRCGVTETARWRGGPLGKST